MYSPVSVKEHPKAQHRAVQTHEGQMKLSAELVAVGAESELDNVGNVRADRNVERTCKASRSTVPRTLQILRNWINAIANRSRRD